jgi:16S rRNA processing protein RimM
LDDFYFIAQIISTGKDGFVKIHSSIDIAENFFQLNNEVYLDYWGKKKKFIVEETIKIKNSVFLKFVNFDDERDSLVLIQRKIFVPKKNFDLLPIKNFIKTDLLGCHVFRDDILMGTVNDIFSAPANDVIEILKLDGKEILIPFVDAFFEIMDVKNKKLILKPNAGYYDDED